MKCPSSLFHNHVGEFYIYQIFNVGESNIILISKKKKEEEWNKLII